LEQVALEKDLQVQQEIMVELVDLDLLEVILFLEVIQLMVVDMELEDQNLLHRLSMLEALAVMAVAAQELMLLLEELEVLPINPMHRDFLVLL
jgi:hypothetical protein|tara:strand:- start:116 stop:394 length:279 start_codon:yes stop_codon:yes gene_type:complete